jgi:surface protein
LERQPLIDDENDDFDVENEEDATKMFGTTLRKKRTTTIKTAATVAFACVGGLFALVSSSSGSSSPASLVKRFVRTNEGVGASSALANEAYGRRTTSTTSFLGFGGKKATTTGVKTTRTPKVVDGVAVEKKTLKKKEQETVLEDEPKPPALDQESLRPKEEEEEEVKEAEEEGVREKADESENDGPESQSALEEMEKSVEEDNSKAAEKVAAASASAGSTDEKSGKVITLHTACSPLERLNFDPKEWTGVVGARIAVARLDNPNLSFSKSIEMRATECGSYEIEEEGVLEDGDNFGFYLYPIVNKDSHAPHLGYPVKDVGCYVADQSGFCPQQIAPMVKTIGGPFGLRECTKPSKVSNEETGTSSVFFSRVYSKSSEDSSKSSSAYQWGSCSETCDYNKNSVCATTQNAQDEDVAGAGEQEEEEQKEEEEEGEKEEKLSKKELLAKKEREQALKNEEEMAQKLLAEAMKKEKNLKSASSKTDNKNVLYKGHEIQPPKPPKASSTVTYTVVKKPGGVTSSTVTGNVPKPPAVLPPKPDGIYERDPSAKPTDVSNAIAMESNVGVKPALAEHHSEKYESSKHAGETDEELVPPKPPTIQDASTSSSGTTISEKPPLPPSLKNSAHVNGGAVPPRPPSVQCAKRTDDKKRLHDETFEFAIEKCLEEEPVQGLCERFGKLSMFGVMPEWDVSCVTDMTDAFKYKTSFNGDLSKWDTKSVVDFSGMFSSAFKFNQDISKWDTSQVTSMFSMFYFANSFDKDISKWDTSNVNDMTGMFYAASKFNKDVRPWNVKKVKSMESMFREADEFDKDAFKHTDALLTTSNMFRNAMKFNSNVNDLVMDSVKDASYMFYGSEKFDQPLDNWNTAKVENMEHMFHYASSFNQNLNRWDTSSATNMNGLFQSASTFNGDISKWNVSKVEKMFSMFKNCKNFNADLSHWRPERAVDMSYMFYNSAFDGDVRMWLSKQPKLDTTEMFVKAAYFGKKWKCEDADHGPPHSCSLKKED